MGVRQKLINRIIIDKALSYYRGIECQKDTN